MLILTRRIGETVIIGDDVFITVLGVKGNQVRLGFDAPEEVSIHRSEIYLKVQQEKNNLLDARFGLNGNEPQITSLKGTEVPSYVAN